MKSMFLAVLASMVFAGAAFAADGGEGNNQGCNGAGNENSPCAEGGDGGAGGSSTVTVDVSQSQAQAQSQSQSQEQGQFQEQGQANVQALTIEDAQNPASSAPNLFLASCNSGASAQGFGGGGSVGGPDEVCLLLNYAQMANYLGDREGSDWAMKEAKNILEVRTNSFLRFLQALPLLRKVL